MAFRKISEEANISSAPGCPVRIRHCSILRDEATHSRYLELDLRNESEKTIAAITALLVCTAEDGSELCRREQLCYAHRNYRVETGEGPVPLVLPPRPCRVSVRLTKILAFSTGDRGAVENITCTE